MNLNRKGVSRSVAAMAVVVVIVIVAAGAYVAYTAANPSVTTVVSTATTTATSIATTTAVSTATTTAISTTTAVLTTATPVAISGGGGTLVAPLMATWQFAYQQATGGQVNYAAIGSGAGIGQITAKTLDFGESDAPLTTAQYGKLPNGTTLLTIPISASGVVPAYNLPNVTAHLDFTGDLLAKIFLGQVTQWNDPAIAALNPSVTLPAHAITVVHRSDGSGTMFAFTNYLSDSNAQWKSQVGKGTSVNWPTGLGCKGNAGVAGCIQGTQYSIGPLEIAYQIQNPNIINYGAVRNAAGNFILANLTNIASALQAGGSGLPAGNAQWTTVSIIDNIFNDTTDRGVYPITTFTYALVYQHQTDQQKGSAVVNFIWWIVNNGQSAGKTLGYPALPTNVVQLDDTTLKSVTYNGTPLYTGP
jgi:phosphate ABC transporter phosphate-binding protein